jgi:hypothetical protein
MVVLVTWFRLQRVHALARRQHEGGTGRVRRLERVQRAGRVQVGVADRVATRLGHVASPGQVHHRLAVFRRPAKSLGVGAHVAGDEFNRSLARRAALKRATA